MRSRPAPGRRPPIGLFALAGAVTAVALFALVSVKVLLGQTAIRAADVEGRIQAKHQRLEQLQLDVARASSPGEIARRAEELGMVRPDAIVPIRPAPPGAATASGQGGR